MPAGNVTLDTLNEERSTRNGAEIKAHGSGGHCRGPSVLRSRPDARDHRLPAALRLRPFLPRLRNDQGLVGPPGGRPAGRISLSSPVLASRSGASPACVQGPASGPPILGPSFPDAGTLSHGLWDTAGRSRGRGRLVPSGARHVPASFSFVTDTDNWYDVQKKLRRSACGVFDPAAYLHRRIHHEAWIYRLRQYGKRHYGRCDKQRPYDPGRDHRL